ncbi:MAG: GRAM domain-containing protein [Nonlabens sp.]
MDTNGAIEIGGDPQKFSWKARIVIVILSAVLHGVFVALIKWLFNDEVLLNDILFQGIGFGLLFGLLFPQGMTHIAGYFNKNVLITPKLLDNEKVHFYGPVNSMHTWIATGGKLFLTGERLIFRAHKYNFPSQQINIKLKDIKNIGHFKSLNVMNNGMKVSTDSKDYKFIVNDRKEWMGKISGAVDL